MAPLLLLLALGAGPAAPAAGLSQLTDISVAVPRAVLEMRYARTDNFLKQAVYAKARCLLRPAAAEALARVETRLETSGLRLKLWDCYRPFSVQKQMWALVPQRGLVADPGRGGSNHNRGQAVDASVTDLEGKDVPVPTAHDDFTRAGRRDAPCADPVAAKNRGLLREAMEAEGFTSIRSEWWHFDFKSAGPAPALDEPL